jgi:HlyD family secretion protein
MIESVEIITNKKENILSVPLAAVTTRESERTESPDGNSKMKELVFVTEGNLAKMIEVKTGISDFESIEIVDGITEGQEVITGPYFVVSKQLEDNKPVKKPEKKNGKQ